MQIVLDLLLGFENIILAENLAPYEQVWINRNELCESLGSCRATSRSCYPKPGEVAEFELYY